MVVSEQGTRIQKVLDFLKRMEEAKIFARLSHNQEDAITVEISVPGQRWEVDFHEDGQVTVEVFRSDGTIESQEAIDRLFQQFSRLT